MYNVTSLKGKGERVTHVGNFRKQCFDWIFKSKDKKNCITILQFS